MLFLLGLVIRALCRLVVGPRDDDGSKDLEILVLRHELTPDAIELGLGAALPAVFEIGKEREFGRGERDCASHTDLSVGVIRLAPVAGSAEGVAR